ncbi:MAG: peptidase M23 [Flavobacteriales bacterium]|nr:peptidase M23 [Flavobacteriales bacterium]|tara:strand:- start:22283 stop:23122 length:840 start_codon:yes stop_codon:yes gene_type:complete
MKKNQDEKRSLWQRLKVRYHLSIVNKNLFLEVYSRNISLGRLILLITASTLSVSLLTYLIIAFTPVKSYIIPGYESASDHAYLIENTKQLFRLQKKVQSKIEYSLKLDSTFQDFGIPLDSINNATFEKVNLEARNNELLPDGFINLSFSEESKSLAYFHFFKPITGLISKELKINEGHNGIDIVAEKNAGVKSTLNGKVILSAWTVETGHVIAIQHSNDLISVYKHNSVLLKKEGAIVKAGEVIAIVGNSGKFTTGPHLHFEIWFKGSPLNPEEVINFE